MSFWGIVGLVLLAVVILSILFAVFHILIMLLPAVVVIAALIWLINRFTKKDDDNAPTGSRFDQQNWSEPWGENGSQLRRKKVRDAETKDVDK
ncbi:hypothetical protein EQ500_09730 [Lactobacillus sp. XV13L]|nr:hypothetical protein [Lactobacillus sp. XV13L]